MDSKLVFERCLNRGLWVASPTPQGFTFVVSDINGVKIASSKERDEAIDKAYSKVVGGLKPPPP